MKISSLTVENFRAIKNLSICDLDDMVVIAGANGSGKSCVFDAIRFLKSAYGGYQHNEFQQFFGEFQIDAGRRASVMPLFNDRSKDLVITAEFRLHKNEENYLAFAGIELLEMTVLRKQFPEAYGWDSSYYARMALQQRIDFAEVSAKALAAMPLMQKEISKGLLRAQIRIRPSGEMTFAPSITLESIFSAFRPMHLGVIDYHGAQRQYAREQIGGINLNLDAVQSQHRNSALYNYSNKYSNIKSELAAQYVRDVIASKASAPPTTRPSIEVTLKELFRQFFPDKEFLGPRPNPDGSLDFPVRLLDGAEHDLNELSSGEKEVLYGYLRLRNSAPQYSIVLLDEPELHLNPRLIRGLPQFFQEHLGKALDNQLWLVTHSDAILREAVGKKGFSLLHMHSPNSSQAGINQAHPINARSELDAALISLVGDLAAYVPNSRVVLLEGGGDTDFDVRMVSLLFADLLGEVNLVSGGNKRRVRSLHEALQLAANKGGLPFSFYSITDQDSDPSDRPTISRSVSWDVYHIENYLLDGTFILKVLTELNLTTTSLGNVDQVNLALHECAREVVAPLVHHHVQLNVNRLLMSAIDISTNPAAMDVTAAVIPAISKASEKIATLLATDLSEQTLRALENGKRDSLNNALLDGKWKSVLRGRDVLKRFVAKHGKGLKYDFFRDLIVARMAEAKHQPVAMKAVLNSVLGENK